VIPSVGLQRLTPVLLLVEHLDVKLVRLVAGQSVASAIESASALSTGIIISGMASWEMLLVMFAMV